MAFDNIQLDKGFYTAGGGFTRALESIDPSEQYRGTALEGLDAYERQLRRFGIRVSGAGSDRVEKFFASSQTAVLFPEYVTRAVRQGYDRADRLEDIVAATTMIDGPDYRPIFSETMEREPLFSTAIKPSGVLVNMCKRGCALSASYEDLRYHRINLFAVALRQIGVKIAKAILADAVRVLACDDEGFFTAARTIPQRLLPARTAGAPPIAELNPTQLGEKIGLKAREVNLRLEAAGLQRKTGKDWRLTEAGRAYGEEKAYDRNGHNDYHIQWQEEALAALREEAAA